MKRILTAALAATVALGTFSAAFAQPRGGGYHRHDEWRKGSHIQRRDWDRGQRVDYRRHKLRAPPRGYEWRQVDGNYVMAAIATGLIASVIANAR